jgi:hypothetical protein
MIFGWEIFRSIIDYTHGRFLQCRFRFPSARAAGQHSLTGRRPVTPGRRRLPPGSTASEEGWERTRGCRPRLAAADLSFRLFHGPCGATGALAPILRRPVNHFLSTCERRFTNDCRHWHLYHGGIASPPPASPRPIFHRYCLFVFWRSSRSSANSSKRRRSGLALCWDVLRIVRHGPVCPSASAILQRVAFPMWK